MIKDALASEMASPVNPTDAAAEITAVSPVVRQLSRVLQEVISNVLQTAEASDASPVPRAKSLTLEAGAKAARVAGTLAIPPGPIGIRAIIPDLLAMWKIQRQRVADIAAIHGRIGRAQSRVDDLLPV